MPSCINYSTEPLTLYSFILLFLIVALSRRNLQVSVLVGMCTPYIRPIKLDFSKYAGFACMYFHLVHMPSVMSKGVHAMHAYELKSSGIYMVLHVPGDNRNFTTGTLNNKQLLSCCYFVSYFEHLKDQHHRQLVD